MFRWHVLIPQNLFFTQGANRNPSLLSSLACCGMEPQPLLMWYFRNLSVCRNVPLYSFDFMELLLTINSVIRCNIAVFVVTGSLVLVAILLNISI